jgi:hypothetical protein
MATSFSGGRSWSIRREPPAMGKQLLNFITCGCESSAPFCNLQRWARTHAVLVIGLYELLGNPTTTLIEAPRPFYEFFNETLKSIKYACLSPKPSFLYDTYIWSIVINLLIRVLKQYWLSMDLIFNLMY